MWGVEAVGAGVRWGPLPVSCIACSPSYPLLSPNRRPRDPPPPLPFPQGKTSHCYRIAYRSMERSLTDDEINELQSQVRQ